MRIRATGFTDRERAPLRRPGPTGVAPRPDDRIAAECAVHLHHAAIDRRVQRRPHRVVAHATSRAPRGWTALNPKRLKSISNVPGCTDRGLDVVGDASPTGLK
jgi:hypothetical protein